METEVVAVERADSGWLVTTADTLFYPEGGGQPADWGSIMSVNSGVRYEARPSGHEAALLIQGDFPPDSEPPFAQGDRAALSLDRERRVRHTICHTAQHLLSAVLLELWQAPTVSMHLGDSGNTVDADISHFTAEMARKTEETVQAAIEADLPVISHICPPEDAVNFPLRRELPQGEDTVRVVEIQGVDFSPCCGTHLPSLGKIGLLRISGWEKYKGKTRIHFNAGHDAWAFDSALRDTLVEAASILEVNPPELPGRITALRDHAAELEKKLKALSALWAEGEVSALGEAASERAAPGRAVVSRSYEKCDAELVTLAAKECSLKLGVPAVFSSVPSLTLICTAPKGSSLNLKELLLPVFSAHQGRGGGGPSMVRGVFDSPEDLEKCRLECAVPF
jgi:alanyl-tRNA synthetase